MAKSAESRNNYDNPYKNRVRRRLREVKPLDDKENKIIIKDWIS